MTAEGSRKACISKMRVNTDQTTPKAPRQCLVHHFNHLSNQEPMSLSKVTPGKNAPDTFNVIIEIPMNADPVKYEVDKESGAIFVDRFMSTSMHYPTNYGYVPQTISGDGDPVDVLVITPVPLIPGVVVTCRPIGILKMTDEAGEDGKVLAVPTDKILSIYTQWQKPEDLNPLRLKTIAHFFEHYKDLEEGKWVKINGWEGPESAKKEITDGIANYQKSLKA
jgi:inorganic pyrophosphatase